MSGGYTTPTEGDLGPLVRELQDARRRISELERPTGTQSAEAVRNLELTIAELQTQSDYLASLITRSSSPAGTLSTGTTPGDQTVRWFDTDPVTAVTLIAATGRVLVRAGCGEASLAPGETSAVAYVSFTITAPSGFSQSYQNQARLFSTSDRAIGASLLVEGRRSAPSNEPITVTTKLGIWSASTVDLASAVFNSPYLTVQVIDAG